MREFLLFMRHLFWMIHFIRGVLLTLLLVLLVFALIVAKVEAMPFSDAVYFIFVTALTIGYGDITPSSGVTKTISILTGVIGVVFVGLLVAVSVRALRDAIDAMHRPTKSRTPRDKVGPGPDVE